MIENFGPPTLLGIVPSTPEVKEALETVNEMLREKDRRSQSGRVLSLQGMEFSSDIFDVQSGRETFLREARLAFKGHPDPKAIDEAAWTVFSEIQKVVSTAGLPGDWMNRVRYDIHGTPSHREHPYKLRPGQDPVWCTTPNGELYAGVDGGCYRTFLKGTSVQRSTTNGVYFFPPFSQYREEWTRPGNVGSFSHEFIGLLDHPETIPEEAYRSFLNRISFPRRSGRN